MKKGATGLLVLIFVVVLMGAALVYFMKGSAPIENGEGSVQPMPPAGVGEVISVTGEVVCLPHKGGDVSRECLHIGLRAAGDIYYGLLDTTPDRLHTITISTQVAVSGILRDAEPNSDLVHVGVIEIQMIEPIAENNKL